MPSASQAKGALDPVRDLPLLMLVGALEAFGYDSLRA